MPCQGLSVIVYFMRRKTTEKPDKEWNKLKQFIACKIDSFSKDFDRNLELYCDVLGYIKLTGIVEDILRNTQNLLELIAVYLKKEYLGLDSEMVILQYLWMIL